MGRVFVSYPVLQTDTSDAATQAWVAEVVDNGGSVSASRKALVDALIVGLKADAIWTKFDRLWLFAAENQPSALTDLKGLALATTVNSPTFTIDRGYTGDGSTNYINSGYTPSVDGVNYTLNSAHFGAWINAVEGNVLRAAGGTVETLNGNITQLYWGATSTWRADVNSLTETIASTGAIGMLVADRPDASNQAIYFNGSLDTNNSSASSTGLSDHAAYFLARHTSSGTADLIAAHQVSAGYMGGSLNSTEQTDFFDRMRTYMTAVGVP